jgi:hypothetical protein
MLNIFSAAQLAGPPAVRKLARCVGYGICAAIENDFFKILLKHPIWARLVAVDRDSVCERLKPEISRNTSGPKETRARLHPDLSASYGPTKAIVSYVPLASFSVI